MSCEYRKSDHDHTMLYIMVVFLLLNSCGGPSSTSVKELRDDVTAICEKLEAAC